jgi:hypothetical protein
MSLARTLEIAMRALADLVVEMVPTISRGIITARIPPATSLKPME